MPPMGLLSDTQTLRVAHAPGMPGMPEAFFTTKQVDYDWNCNMNWNYIYVLNVSVINDNYIIDSWYFTVE